ncbi:type VI secretion system baseplate subunit TssF [uncultured Azohydromonas sp.]|jgi:type VI secretion protein, VC_A0110 family|uniref:type VI secretion system baseplate subunit TssF n=1 Tax=uncultured Azohydromonas sp. TaxID=487342 RepID=UPI002612DB2F|nr:type VI secretion system baseplate subunit TssF [uncultured Azohydromonas sp.]
MHRLLPYYEAELAALGEPAEDFARRYPRIAGCLAASAELPQDPHVERLIQAFALLSARIHKRLDDDFPLLTATLLELLAPQDLRPFPSCAIARFEPAPWTARPGAATLLPRGTVLDAIPGPNPACRFTTTAPTQLLPLHVAAAGCRSAAATLAGMPLPLRTGALLSLRLALAPQAPGWGALGVQSIRLFLDGDASLVALLRETLCSRVLAALVQASPQGPWQADATALPRAVGLEDDEALVEPETRAPEASRLLVEYFAYPEKFNFIDLPLPAAARASHSRELSLHYALAGPLDADAARLLELASAGNFVTGCVPVINLFRRRADPIRIDHRSALYTVLPDAAAAAAAHEVYAIDRVLRTRETATGSRTEPVVPLHALHHEALLREGPVPRLCWWAQRNPALAQRSPGHEMEIGLLDAGFDPAQPATETLSIELRATNRDLPTRMRIGQPDGDLALADGGGAGVQPVIRLLRKPTPPRRLESGGEGLWRLISHLTLNLAGPVAGDIDALKALLRLHDLPRSVQAERLMAGLQAVEYEPAEACVAGNPFATVVHGTRIRLSVDERHFVGSGLWLFAQVLERCFGLQAQLNTFTQLQVLSARTGQLLIDGPRRSGAAPLA